MKATFSQVWLTIPVLWLALAVSEAIAREAFHNVSFFAGPLEKLQTAAEQQR